MQHIKPLNQFLNEAKKSGDSPEWHDSDAPDANGKFKELNIEDLAAWLIKTRNKDLKKITGSLNQQIVFNRGEDKAYADKMEKVRKEVYRQLGREDLLERFNVNKYSPMSYAEKVVSGSLSLEDAMEESGMPFTLLMSLIKKIDKNFKFTFEEREWNDKRKGPHPYHATLSDEDEEAKKDQMKKQTKMSDSDPDAYKEMPGDAEAREEGKVKTSKHVKRYHELYGDEEQNESYMSLGHGVNYKYQMTGPYKVKATVCYLDPMTRQRKCTDIYFRTELDAIGFKDNVKGFPKGAEVESIRNKKVDEAVINEEQKQSTDKGPIDSEAIETALKKKANDTGVPIGIIRAVMRRGMAAWKTGHRPGATEQQWGYARVNSFLTKQDGTWGGADKDLADEVRAGGHDKNMK